jgi:universal stress protein family protein
MTENAMGGRIVVGVDGSESSKAALRWAARILAATGGFIDAVIAWQPPPYYGWGYVGPEWNPEDEARKVLNAAVDEAFGADRPIGTRLTVQRGNPAKVLLDQSKGAALPRQGRERVVTPSEPAAQVRCITHAGRTTMQARYRWPSRPHRHGAHRLAPVPVRADPVRPHDGT